MTDNLVRSLSGSPRPVAYLRKSVVRNPEKDLSPETQEREVRGLAARHNDNGDRLLILADWDISGSGKYTKKRASYQQLLSAIETGVCSAVYSYSLSRLGRSVHELSGLFDMCHQRGVPIRLVADSLDTSTASGLLLANMLSSVAQFESDVAAERTKAANATRRARGERVGPRFYGETDGEDAQAVIAAFRETGSYNGAAKLLNERGVPTRYGRQGGWKVASVVKIVQRLDPTVQPGKARTKAVVPFRLARLLRCPICDGMLSGRRDRGTIRYTCAHGSLIKPHVRSSITEKPVLDAVKAEVARLVLPPEVETAGDEMERLALAQQKSKVIDAWQEGLIDRSDRDQRLVAIAEKMARLDAKSSLLTVPEIDWDWAPGDLNKVLRALFETIRLDPETFQPARFVWRVPEWRAE